MTLESRKGATVALVVFVAALTLAASSFAAGPPAADGAVKDSDAYEVVAKDVRVALGEGVFTVVVLARGVFKVNKDYPQKLTVQSQSKAVELPKTVFTKADGTFSDDHKKFTFRVPFKAPRAGSFRVTGQLKFSVCSDKSCLLKKAAIDVTIDVE